jgi:hypothetical protein
LETLPLICGWWFIDVSLGPKTIGMSSLVLNIILERFVGLAVVPATKATLPELEKSI